MKKALVAAAAFAWVTLGAGAASAAVRTIEFTADPTEFSFGWFQVSGTERPFGAPLSVSGYLLVDDQINGAPRSINGVVTPTLAVIGGAITTGSKTWDVQTEGTPLTYAAYLAGDLVQFHVRLNAAPTLFLEVAWGSPRHSTLNLFDGVNQSYCNSCLTYVERIGDTVISQGGPLTAPIPEPATWAMLIAGFGLTGIAIRRRKSAAAFT